MFSRFLGKGNKSSTPSQQDGSTLSGRGARGLEVIENDPETVWGLWDSALAEQDSRSAALESIAEPAKRPAAVAAMPPQRSASTDEIPTQPMELDQEEASPEQRRDTALQVVERHHQRIANTIRSMWGYKECSMYINKLIMNGGDGMGHSRVGFNQDAAVAMMTLSDLHETQFGPAEPDTELGFASPSVRTGFDGLR